MARLTNRQEMEHSDGTKRIETYCHGHRYGPAAFPGKYGSSDPQEYKNYCQMIDTLATYEDAEEQGHLVWLPCRVGDTVFSLWSRVDSKKQYIRSAIITVANLMYYLSRIQCGTTFTTRQEAEKALEATP